MNAIHAVFGFLGALLSAFGWRLYRLFSLPLGVDVSLERHSRADVESDVSSSNVPSGSTKDSEG